VLPAATLIAALCNSTWSAVDLKYQGAFKVSGFSYGGDGLAYYPQGNGGAGSLYILGIYGRIGEVTIPGPVLTPDHPELPTATTLRAPTTNPGFTIRGLTYLPAQAGQTSGKLYYGSAAQSADVHGYCDLDVTNFQGPWTPQGLDCRRLGHYIIDIPAAWAAANVGGKRLATGFGWQPFGRGPCLYAYTALPEGEPPALPSTKLIEYSSTHPWSGYNADDRWECGSWVTVGADSAVLIGGLKVMAGGQKAAVLFYDPDDLAQVAAGTLQAWEVEPYRVQSYDVFTFGAHVFAGMTYDSAGQKLYVSEYVNSSLQVVHVFNVVATP
jgi:hypothetical protein